MLNILQNIFIVVLKPISRVSCKLDDRARDICIQLICILFPLYFIWYYTGLQHRELIPDCVGNHTAKQLMGCIFLLLLVVFSLDRVPKNVRWNRWIMYPMIICGIWMMIISFIHPVGSGYRAFAMMLIFVFPCVYFVWNNRGDYEKLFDPLARAVCLTGLLFFAFSFYLAANGDFVVLHGRCSGLLENANQFSMVGMVSTCGALYLLVKDHLFSFRFIFYSIALGAGIAIVLMGQSRASLAVCLVNSFVCLFFLFRYNKSSKCSVIILKLLLLTGFVITMVLLSQQCVLMQYNIEAGGRIDTVTEQEVTSAIEKRQDNEPSVTDRFTYEGDSTLDHYTAGRYSVWMRYMRHFNLLGNDFSKVDWNDLTQNTVRHAHNNFFEMSYRFGVPLGLLFILFEIIVCLKALQYLFLNRQKRIVLLLPILFVVMFFFESMLDIATLPFERDAPFYFYMAIIPMVDLSYRFKDKT